eukprot:scaffold15394_cov111-Isochrysis_galbana.AAC.1
MACSSGSSEKIPASCSIIRSSWNPFTPSPFTPIPFTPSPFTPSLAFTPEGGKPASWSAHRPSGTPACASTDARTVLLPTPSPTLPADSPSRPPPSVCAGAYQYLCSSHASAAATALCPCGARAAAPAARTAASSVRCTDERREAAHGAVAVCPLEIRTETRRGSMEATAGERRGSNRAGGEACGVPERGAAAGVGSGNVPSAVVVVVVV